MMSETLHMHSPVAAMAGSGVFGPADAKAVRADFPLLSRLVRGKPLAYLDNAATTQKPLSVIQTQCEVYQQFNANPHRGLYLISQEATDEYEGARKKVADFIGATEASEIIFTKGATEAINLVVSSWGRTNIHKDDVVVVSAMEHHSNFVPWQSLCLEKEAKFLIWEMAEGFTLDADHLEKILAKTSVKLVAVTAMSNVTGYISDVLSISAMAKKYGARVLVDASQAIAHAPIDVAQLPDVDFIAFSSHKVYGPTGVGVLWGRKELLEAMPPYQFGGDMILNVGDATTTWNELPWKFEAGTPNYADAIAFGSAIDYISRLGISHLGAYERSLAEHAREALEELVGVKLITPGDAARRGPCISFTVEGIHPHDIATALDRDGIAIRAGHHCTAPLMRRLGVSSVSRASFSFYNTVGEMERLVEALRGAQGYFL